MCEGVEPNGRDLSMVMSGGLHSGVEKKQVSNVYDHSPKWGPMPYGLLGETISETENIPVCLKEFYISVN